MVVAAVVGRVLRPLDAVVPLEDVVGQRLGGYVRQGIPLEAHIVLLHARHSSGLLPAAGRRRRGHGVVLVLLIFNELNYYRPSLKT